jgi:hypothetical protein
LLAILNKIRARFPVNSLFGTFTLTNKAFLTCFLGKKGAFWDEFIVKKV